MAIAKKISLLDQISECSDFIDSVSFKNVKDNKDLRELVAKLEKANDIITDYYNMLLDDYVTIINSDLCFNQSGVTLNTVIKYRNLAKKVHKLYNYIIYMATFENPFK